MSQKATGVGNMDRDKPKEIMPLNELVRLISNCGYEDGFQDLVHILKRVVATHDYEEHIKNGGY